MSFPNPTISIKYVKGELCLQCMQCGRTTHDRLAIESRECLFCKQKSLQNNLKPYTSPLNIDQEDLTKTLEKSLESLRDKNTNGNSASQNQLIEQVPKKVVEVQPLKKSKRSKEVICPKCKKNVEVIDEIKFFNQSIRTYSCKHKESLNIPAFPEGRDELWSKFFPFQQKGIEFIEEADFSGLIGDEMGLGKTIQALGILRYSYTELTPCLIICESSKVYDWKDEFNHWTGKDKLVDAFGEYKDVRDEPMIHFKGGYGLCPGIKNHIISMSLLEKDEVLKSIKEYGFKFMIVDESHSFKNDLAKRSKAILDISTTIPFKVFLSGTPVMNRVMEYFIPLHILRPQAFPSKNYLAQRCDYSNNKALGLSAWYRDKFFRETNEFIIRRTKKEVGIQLPKLMINKQFINLNSDKLFTIAYNDQIDELEKVLNRMKSEAGLSTQIMVIITKMRQIIGLAKVKPIVSLVKEFMDSTEPTAKLALGVHHKFVMSQYAEKLSEYNPICISDEDPLVKMKKIEEFKRNDRRLGILSILGAGQGLNLQFCQNAMIVEREWNPAREEQFANRFHRIGKNPDGTVKIEYPEDESVIIDYHNAKGTIDEFFDAIVNLKKEIVGSTLDQDYLMDRDIIMTLVHKIVESSKLIQGF